MPAIVYMPFLYALAVDLVFEQMFGLPKFSFYGWWFLMSLPYLLDILAGVVVALMLGIVWLFMFVVAMITDG